MPGLGLQARGYDPGETNPQTRTRSLQEAIALRGTIHWAYGPLFAQRFLAVVLDLGTAFATSFQASNCVAQELALRLVLDQVDLLPELLPSLKLSQDWHDLLLGSLFEDLVQELLYIPALDGISHESSRGMAEPDVSAWFTPFMGRTLNPYAANE